MEPTRSAITKHCSRLSGLRCAAPPIRVPDRLRGGYAAEDFSNVAALQTHLRQLITLRLEIAPPVTAHHPVAPSSLVLPPTAGFWYRGEVWELYRAANTAQNWASRSRIPSAKKRFPET